MTEDEMVGWHHTSLIKPSKPLWETVTSNRFMQVRDSTLEW